MPNQTQITAALTVVAVMVLYNMIAPRVGLPTV